MAFGTASGHWQYWSIGALQVHWFPAAKEDFVAFKTTLTSSPVLHSTDFNLPFLLQTDASEMGFGVVLSQVFDGEEHPVANISSKLSPAENGYTAMVREALAIKVGS